MKKSFKKVLGLTLTIFAILFFNSAFAEAVKSESKTKKSAQKTKSFYVESREPYLSNDDNELCRITAKILNEPENERFSEIGFAKNAEFTVPEKYKDFSFPEWVDVPREDLAKYVKSEKWLGKVTRYEDLYKADSAKAVLQKTQLDLDHDGKNEEILRIKFSNRMDSSWGCYVSDVVETVVTKSYNMLQSPFYGCYFFKYKEKLFQVMKQNYDYFSIREPVTPAGTMFAMYPICTISLTPLRKRIVEKAVNKIWADDDKKSKAALDLSNAKTSNPNK